MQRLPRLVFIADAPTLPGEAFFDAVRQGLMGAPPGTMTLLERDGGWATPKTSDHMRLQRLRRLRELSEEAQCLLVVSGRADLAEACGAHGVHLPSRGISTAAAKRAFPALMVSRSCHDQAELQEAKKEGADWVTLSPLFTPLSKPSSGDGIGPEQFASMTGNQRLKIFALGGITPPRVSIAVDSGAYGVACLGSILCAPDPTSEVASLLSALARSSPLVEERKPCDVI